MLRKDTATSCVAILAFAGLLHCSSSNSEPKTAANESGSDPSATPGAESDTDSTSHGAGDTPSGGGSSADQGSARSPGATALDDAQIAAITANVNRAEVEQGKLAQSKAQNTQVRSFAAMMVEHHGEALSDQQGLSISKKESPDSQHLATEAANALASLQQKSGAEFDRAYIQLQCDEHRKVLNDLDQKLLPAAQDPGLKAYLQKLKPRVQEHLAQAERLQKELGSSSSSSSQSTDSTGAPRALNR